MPSRTPERTLPPTASYLRSTSLVERLVGEPGRQSGPGERAGLRGLEVVRVLESELGRGQTVDGHSVGERLRLALFHEKRREVGPHAQHLAAHETRHRLAQPV